MVAHAQPSFSSPGDTLRRVKSIRILMHLNPFHPFMQLDLVSFALVSKKGVKGILGTPEWRHRGLQASMRLIVPGDYPVTNSGHTTVSQVLGSNGGLLAYDKVSDVGSRTDLSICPCISIQHLPPFPRMTMSCSKPFFIDPYIRILSRTHVPSLSIIGARVYCFACAPDMRHWNIVEAG